MLNWFQFLSKPTHKLIKLNDLPDEVRDKAIYYVGTKRNEWLLLLVCPCGCNEQIFLNTLPEADPRWELTSKQKKYPSIYPSIRRTIGCKSHFYIKRGRVIWVRDLPLYGEG